MSNNQRSIAYSNICFCTYFLKKKMRAGKAIDSMNKS